jgi:DNA-binding transcriptional ArsR family regulator
METALAIVTQILKDGAGVLRVLNNRTRQSIIKYLHKEGKSNVTPLYKKLQFSQAEASQHLRILREGRFVITERQGNLLFAKL